MNKRYRNNWGGRTTLNRCGGKPVYDKKTAITAKNKRWKDDHVKLRVYNCHRCGGWHLTSKEKYE